MSSQVRIAGQPRAAKACTPPPDTHQHLPDVLLGHRVGEREDGGRLGDRRVVDGHDAHQQLGEGGRGVIW
jgi:hypothetical protein